MDSESLGAAGGASLGGSFGHRLVFGSRLWIGGTLRGQNKSVPVTSHFRFESMRTATPEAYEPATARSTRWMSYSSSAFCMEGAYAGAQSKKAPRAPENGF